MFRVYHHEWDETSLFDETTRHPNDFHTFYEQMHVFAAPNCKQVHDEWLETHIDSVCRHVIKDVIIQCFQYKLQELAETLSTHVDPQDVPDEYRDQLTWIRRMRLL
jgi:arylamine N-acetyltransferase